MWVVPGLAACLLLTQHVQGRIAHTPFGPAVPSKFVVHSLASPAASFVKRENNNNINQQKLALAHFDALGIDYTITSQFVSQNTGILHTHATQIVNEIPVSNSALGVNIDTEGNIVTEYNTLWTPQSQDAAVAGLGQGQFVFAGQGDSLPAPAPDNHNLSPQDALIRFAQRFQLQIQPDSLKIEQKSTRDGTHQHIIHKVPFAVNNQVPISKKYVINPEDPSGISLVWDVEVEMDENWFVSQIDANSGKILRVIDYHQDSPGYYVFPPGINDPSEHPQVWLEDLPHIPSSPKGWHETSTKSYTSTKGNNVVAIDNISDDGWPDYSQGSVDGGENLIFNSTYDLLSDPAESIDAAVTQLFVTCNWIHDVFYAYGFDEVSGNFQEDNFGKGGSENDAVRAHAQDGSGVNNANFATPPDGRPGKMRMYVWTTSSPSRDGDFEAGIVIHEYAHGISTRLTGGPANSGCLGFGEAGGMGEGWGDIFATILRMNGTETRNTSYGMGNWAAGRGIRPHDYSTDFKINPQTYGFLKIHPIQYQGVHGKGAVWATILYDLYWTFMENLPDLKWSGNWYDPNSGANTRFLQVIVTAMKLQPCHPNFVSARDAIFQAAKVEHIPQDMFCKMWSAFAKRGLGKLAKSAFTSVLIKEDFSVPAECK